MADFGISSFRSRKERSKSQAKCFTTAHKVEQLSGQLNTIADRAEKTGRPRRRLKRASDDAKEIAENIRTLCPGFKEGG